MSEPRRFDWADLGYTGMASADGFASRVEWRVLEIVVYEPHIGWWPGGGINAFPEATDPDKAHVVVEIDVRVDGCANFSWAADEAVHTCSLADTRKLAEMLVRVVESTPEVLANV